MSVTLLHLPVHLQRSLLRTSHLESSPHIIRCWS